MANTNAINHPAGARAATGARPASGRHSAAALAHLHMLRARLAIFLYRNPLDNNAQIIDVIDNTESCGEIKMLLDYVLEQRVIHRSLRRKERACA